MSSGQPGASVPSRATARDPFRPRPIQAPTHSGPDPFQPDEYTGLLAGCGVACVISAEASALI